MLKSYFCPRVVTRLCSYPEFGVIQAFACYLHHRGHRRTTVQCYIRQIELFLRSLRKRRRVIASLTERDIRRFSCRQKSRQRPQADCHAALRHLARQLREQGLIRPKPPAFSKPIERIVTAFDEHLREVAGLAPATRHYHRRYAGEFMRMVFGAKAACWSRVRPAQVHAFLAHYCRAGHRSAARAAGVSLRVFFRWLQFTGFSSRDLILAVPLFRRWRHTVLPSALSDDAYGAFLDSFDRTTVVGRRDNALAVCMGDLGLRVGEVVDLMLADLDEASATLRVAAGKTRRGRVLPMPQRVRQAIFAYLRHGRPTSTDPHLFLRHRTPVGVGMSRALVRGVVRRAFAKVIGCEHLTGTHILRRTAATRLHRAGADFKRIADILGHRSIDTAAIYAKVDVDSLARVALKWPTAKGVRP